MIDHLDCPVCRESKKEEAEKCNLQEYLDEETRRYMDKQVFLAQLRDRLLVEPTFLKDVILTALSANFETSAIAQKQINQASLLFSVVSKKERARWLAKGINPVFLTNA